MYECFYATNDFNNEQVSIQYPLFRTNVAWRTATTFNISNSTSLSNNSNKSRYQQQKQSQNRRVIKNKKDKQTDMASRLGKLRQIAVVSHAQNALEDYPGRTGRRMIVLLMWLACCCNCIELLMILTLPTSGMRAKVVISHLQCRLARYTNTKKFIYVFFFFLAFSTALLRSSLSIYIYTYVCIYVSVCVCSQLLFSIYHSAFLQQFNAQCFRLISVYTHTHTRSSVCDVDRKAAGSRGKSAIKHECNLKMFYVP